MILYNSRKTTKDILPAIGYRGEQDHLRKKQASMNIQYREQHTVQYSIVEWSDFEEKEGTNLKKKIL